MLQSVKVGSDAPIAAPAAMHRVFVFDVSGSMSWALPNLRQSIKNKVPALVNPGDKISIVWFSGRRQAGVLQEAVEIRSIADFTDINRAVDKFLQPVGLTGFVEPFQLAGELLMRVKRSDPALGTMLFFHTDGMDNQWSEGEIMAAVAGVAPLVDKAAVVEYGWYCNRKTLTRIAEVLGAATLFAEDFPKFEDSILDYVKNGALGKRVSVDVPNASKPYAFAVAGSEIVTYGIENGAVMVPEGIGSVYYFNSNSPWFGDETAQYAALYVLAQRMDSDGVYRVLGNLGDVALIEQFSTCFSAQDYSKFQDAVLAAVGDATKRFVKGQNANALPKDDAFTVIDLLEALASDKGNRFYPYDPRFQYTRISAKREDAAETLGDEDRQALIDQINAAVAPGDLEGVKEMIAKLASKKALKFTPDALNPGVPILTLTYNEERPNISIQVRIDGTVTLSENEYGVPTTFPTFVYRNYAMVADGIKHKAMGCLPFQLTGETEHWLTDNGVSIREDDDGMLLIDADLPVVNRKMVGTVFASDFFRDAVLLLQAKGAQKVYNTFFKEKFEKRSVAWDALYGVAGANWLKEIGLTEWGGFNPPSKTTEPTDMYVAKEFEVKVAGCSSLPTVNQKLLDKVRNGSNLTKSEGLLAPAIREVDAFLASDVYKNAANQDALYQTWLTDKMNAAKRSARHLIKEMAKVKFAIMVGHTWFAEFGSLDENAMSVTVDGVAYDCSAILRDVEIKI